MDHRPHPWLAVEDRAAAWVPPTTLEGIEPYLGSGMGKGIGPYFARTLVQAFGAEVFDVIAQPPARVQALDGIGPTRTARVVAAWAEQQGMCDSMIFLHSHGIGTARAVHLYKTYGTEVMARLQEHPYRLRLDMHGWASRPPTRWPCDGGSHTAAPHATHARNRTREEPSHALSS